MKPTLFAVLAGAFATSLSPAKADKHVSEPYENRGMFRARGFTRRSPRPTGPHSAPMVTAICRRPDGTGRRYFQCRTREQAIAHHPYLIEYVNGWGQVTRRERLSPEARHDQQ